MFERPNRDDIKGGTATMHGALGLGGNTIPAAHITALREEAQTLMNGTGSFRLTELKSVIVVRYLGDASEMARKLMLLAWKYLRPELVGREAIGLRMWTT